MDRYAVINSLGVVTNIIVWDGISSWKPPEGSRIEIAHDLGIGDFWVEELKEFARPLSKAKTPEDPESIRERQEIYMKAKEELKASMLFVRPNETIDNVI